MVKAKENYEDLRNKRLEENKKKVRELNLPLLALKLKAGHSPTPSPMKREKPRVLGTEIVEVRRSSRVASLPDPDHKESVIYERVTIIKSGSKYSYFRKRLGNRVYTSDEARCWAATKAEELEASLEDGYPSFVKPIVQSYVTGAHLSLPAHFCRKYLPKDGAIVTLIDEEGDEFPAVNSDYKWLSGGWKGFSISHELVDGDALVFQLIEPTVFKVYIIRCKGYEEGEKDEDMEA